MSEKTGKKGTYCSLSKWFKWSSSIIILVPIVIAILVAVNLGQGGGWKQEEMLPWCAQGVFVMWIILVVSAVIWTILNIIMFLAAGTVRGDGPSPLKIRIGLLIALVLVLAPLILGLVDYYGPHLGEWAVWVGTFGPIVGFIIGAIMGSSLQHNLD